MAEMRLAQWVTLHSIYACLISGDVVNNSTALARKFLEGSQVKEIEIKTGECLQREHLQYSSTNETVVVEACQVSRRASCMQQTS